jgi:hypothetical protein
MNEVEPMNQHLAAARPGQRPAPDEDDFRAAVMRGFRAGRRRAMAFGLSVLIGGLALGLGPHLSDDAELARAGWMGLLALYGLAGALALSGVGLIALGWLLPRARADQLIGLLNAQPCAVLEAGRLVLRAGGRGKPVAAGKDDGDTDGDTDGDDDEDRGGADEDDGGPQQLYVRTARGLRLRVPMGARDLTLALRYVRIAAPTAVVHGLD